MNKSVASGKLKNKKTQDKKLPIIMGALSAISIFILGFGVMLIMYNYWQNNLTDSYADLKGLFDYKASLWGDAFCLPLVVGAGVTYILVFLKKVKLKRRLLFPVLAGIVGGIVGFAMQMQWVISDTTALNWSIPEKHQFNYAGWYHAFFFVIVCFLVSFISANLIQIDAFLFKHNELISPYEEKIYSFCQYFIWLSGILFLQLHFLDDFSEEYPQWCIILFWTIIGVTVLCGFRLVLLKRKRTIKYYTPIIFAVVTSTILSFISISEPLKCDISFLISSILFSALYVSNSENKAKMFFLALLFGSVTWLCHINVSVQLDNGHIILAIVSAVCCILFPFVISILNIKFFEKQSKDYSDKFLIIISFASILSIILIVLANINTISTLTKGLEKIEDFKYEGGTFLIGSIIPYYVEYTFNEIKRIEDERYDSKVIDKYKLSQYIVYFLIYASALILLINCLYFDLSISFGTREIVIVVATVVIIAICCVLIKWAKSKKFSILFLVLCYLSISLYLIVTGINNTSLVLAKLQSFFDSISFWIVITLIVIYACTISVFMTLSFMNNVGLIRQVKMTRQITVSAIIIGVLSGLCYGLAGYQLLLIQTVFYMIQMLIVTMLAFAIIPYLQASVLNPGGDVGILDNYARSSVMQDGFLYSAVVTVNPIVTISLINNILKGYWAPAILLYFAYSIILAPLWSYCVRNNVEHCQKKEALYLEKKEETASSKEKEELSKQFINLKIHLTIQNIIAIILSIPYSPIFIVKNIYDNHKNEGHGMGLLPK